MMSMHPPSLGPLFDQPFAGSDYDDERDRERLGTQLKRVYECMKDGKWRTLNEIHEVTGAPQSSISAQLRHLKARLGDQAYAKRHVGKGLWEYRIII